MPENQTKPYKTFEDLEVYQAAREFRKRMYRLVTQLPDQEKFALANQIRRAAVSLANNIAEGQGRFHFLDQIKFTLQARGSLEELLDDLNVCLNERYGTVEEIEVLKSEAWRVHKVINGYIRFLRGRVLQGSPRLQESPADTELSDDEMTDLVVGRFNRSTF